MLCNRNPNTPIQKHASIAATCDHCLRRTAHAAIGLPPEYYGPLNPAILAARHTGEGGPLARRQSYQTSSPQQSIFYGIASRAKPWRLLRLITGRHRPTSCLEIPRTSASRRVSRSLCRPL
ncbi:hypothetical protein PHLGIDRAFT_386128 [Phlebiopsis gigantea 11061_1 CR5-6]|uniref:Uncharacterized protein n=1 Tax=Phlebiopsis gigantea (strain 11061_1 CR5-6) TaxID=745531 RepID=A0A0C3SBR0_PHLG1|nr:hypothetical protein PHLGIDRAFT_386128 [Phlebiopsis gigantea 11061_1 CR5-6]